MITAESEGLYGNSFNKKKTQRIQEPRTVSRSGAERGETLNSSNGHEQCAGLLLLVAK